MIPSVLLSAVALLPPPVASAQDERVDAWGEDLITLFEGIEELHPDPFRGTPREDFEAAIDDIYGRLPDLTDDQVIVELMRFVALISSEGRDGHSGLTPTRVFHHLPIRLYRFSDGWFVVAAAPPHARLVGRRVVALGDTPIEEACDRIAPLLTKDCPTNLLTKLPPALIMPELLHALGITTEREQTTLRLETQGDELSAVTLAGSTFTEYTSWAGFRPPPLPSVEGALWLSNGSESWWMRVLEEERALYVQYNVVQATTPGGRSVGDFGAEIVRTFEEQELERVVLDVRLNGGGDNTTFGPLIEALRGSDRLNERGRLYGLIGRGTFSAAGNFVTGFQRDLDSILLGEPTGGGPNQYGDARNVTLPNHPDLIVRISTRYHELGGPDDERLTHRPDVAVPLSSTDYFGGRDPVLAAALAHTE